VSETSTLTGPLRKMYEEAGALVFRMPVGKIQKGKHWVHLCPEGTADLLVFPRSGGVFWVETKDPTGTTAKTRREAQGAFRARVEALGHRYLRVTSINEGMAAL
jgi:hypothetical protein